MKQRLKSREQRHEERDSLAATQLFELVGQRSGQNRRFPGTAKCLDCWTWLIRWQFQHRRRTLKLLAPVSKLRIEKLALQQFALPLSKVRVLNRQIGKVYRTLVKKSLIKRRHFTE